MADRIGILTPALAHGGAEDYAVALARWVADQGQDVAVCLPNVPAVASVRTALEAAAIPAMPLLYERESALTSEGFALIRRAALELLSAHRFDRLVIVLPYTDFGGPLIHAAATAGIPSAVVYQLTCAYEFGAEFREIYSWSRRQRQAWAAVSEEGRDHVCRALGWVDDAVSVVPNGLLRLVRPPGAQARAAARRELRAELGIGQDAHVVLTLARVHPQKAPEVVAATARLLASVRNDVHFVWAGEHPPRDPVVEAAGANLHFVGRRADVDRCLGGADAFVLASRFEGCPFAVLEALATGLPCILSDIPAHRAIVEHGRSGWLVPVGDARGLAMAVTRVLDDAALARRLADGACAASRDLEPGTAFRRLFDLLERECAGIGARSAAWPRSARDAWRRVAIYGAGSAGRQAFEAMGAAADVVAFIDGRTTGTGGTLLGRPVVPPEAVMTLEVDGVVIASVWVETIMATLRRLGYPAERVRVFSPADWASGIARKK